MVRKLECKRPVSVPGQQLSGPQHQANCAASLPIPRVNRFFAWVQRVPSPSGLGEGQSGWKYNSRRPSDPPGPGRRHGKTDEQSKAGNLWPLAARQRPDGEEHKPAGEGQSLG